MPHAVRQKMRQRRTRCDNLPAVVRSQTYASVVSAGAPNGDLSSALQGEYELLLARVRQQREQADRFRTLADELEDRTQRDEHLLEELAGTLGIAAQLRIEDLSPRLRGRRLQEVAIEVLETHWGVGREIHYRAWFDLVQERAGRVGGKDPLATFLAQIHRAPGIERVGRRTGRYQLSSN